MPTDTPTHATNEYQHAARREFFAAIRAHCPRVLKDLAGAPFEAYRKWLDRAQHAEVPDAPSPLRDELEAWAARHHLTDPW